MKQVVAALVEKWGRPGTAPNVIAFCLYVAMYVAAGYDYSGFFALVTHERFWLFPATILTIIVLVVSKRAVTFRLSSGGVELEVNGKEPKFTAARSQDDSLS